MFRIRLAFAAVLLVPSLVSAQRGGGGRMGGSTKADFNAVASKTGPGGPSIEPKDFQEKSIYKLFVDKKKDLKLSDAQISAFKEADSKLKESNGERFKLLDSLVKDAKPKTSGTPSAEDEARMVLARDALNGVVRDIRASYDDAAKATVSGVDEAQKKAAEELMQKYNEEMTQMVREKLGGRGAGPAEGGRRGRGGSL